ncbi:hypothetical protein EN871_29270 [bacterium M00.F.Ca.ET.228.01.1.1]|nr:hypothetical protein EN871_29270 [bacterium M00.F.Ca.ET.228.01.1.1]TGR96544.1 hypothetical protein EN834_28320 [bacterium M00.F.Ca.ET.191.01.1.1]TGT97780.1 hypothetical protein EN798_28325 [bacterium M00.F.Ca.ET.155.01.1.1]
MKTFAYGAFGSLLPDIVLFHSKGITAPALDFTALQFALGTLIYAISAGVVAHINPYQFSRNGRWNAVIMGIAFPVMVSSALSFVDRAVLNPQQGLQPRGAVESSGESASPRERGTLIDLMSLF